MRPWWGLFGVGVFATGLVLLVGDVPFWNTLWFLFAWIGWLFVVDAAIAWRGGVSFVLGRRRELGAMLLWSVPYWCVFEAYNLVLENWYYVFLPHSEVVQGLFAFVAFATVLPACFFHADLLRVVGAFDAVRWRPLRITPAVEAGIAAFGVACAVLPLLWPRTCFWLVWGATWGIPALINRRRGWPSLLADLEAGRPARLLRLLAGGLIAGGVWEGLNFWARAKWVYTVPGFEDVKLFEMPVLGFLGFPALAVEAFAAYVLLCGLVRGGRHWERADADQPRVPRGHPARAVVLLAGFSALTNVLTLDPAVQARRPLLGELGLDAQTVGALVDAGIGTPEWVCRRVEADGVAAVAATVGASEASVDLAYRRADLALHKGMGAAMARALQGVGVARAADLADHDPDVLHAALVGRGVPVRPAQVRVWVRAARFADGRRR